MNKTKTNIVIFVVVLTTFITSSLYSQGCSDAGFCTVNSIRPTEPADSTLKEKNTIKGGITVGGAQYNVFIITPYFEYSRVISKKFATSLKLLYSIHDGDITTTHGLSDVIATVNYKASPSIYFVGGLKIPFNTGNLSHNGLPLPMSYQTSLGTLDGILGIGFKKKDFNLTFAYQQPLTQNKNEFFVEDYPPDEINNKYISTNNYFRKADILLRLSYNVTFAKKKMVFIPSILPIYHVSNDSYVNKTGERVDIADSQGLTFNINLFYQYYFTETQSLEFSVGAPVVSRDVRPDGLSQYAVGLEYSIKF